MLRAVRDHESGNAGKAPSTEHSLRARCYLLHQTASLPHPHSPEGPSCPPLCIPLLSTCVRSVSGSAMPDSWRDPMDCSLSGSSIHSVSQAGMVEWVAFPSPRDLPGPFPNPGLLHCMQILYCWKQEGSP